MTTSAEVREATRNTAGLKPLPADALVVFGITGDLAKVMTFRSLYRLEQRGLLDCPIIGVAVNDWTVDQLRVHARESIEGTGETLDPKVFDRFAQRLSYISGDFTDAATYERVADALDGKATPVFYLEIPPFLFGPVVKNLAAAGLTKTGRVVVEKPFGNDLGSARALAAELHESIDESQIYRIDHFLGKRGSRSSLPAVREHDARAGLEPELHRVRRDHDGRELRHRRPRPLLRSRRRAARRRRQSPHAGRRSDRDGGSCGL
jgi:glucose-6-phosphate 1-dehydrogenase